MAKHNDDYIPTYAELERDTIARKEQWKNSEDPQKIYLCKYKIDGRQFEEKVAALDLKSAEEKLNQQWGLCGCIVRDLVTTIDEEK